MFLQHNIILNIYYTTCWPLEVFDSDGQFVNRDKLEYNVVGVQNLNIVN